METDRLSQQEKKKKESKKKPKMQSTKIFFQECL